MFAVLIGLQAGLPFFDFSIIRGKVRQEYFSAVQAGLDYNFAPMKAISRGCFAVNASVWVEGSVFPGRASALSPDLPTLSTAHEDRIVLCSSLSLVIRSLR
jgi:hypothetical protein